MTPLAIDGRIYLKSAMGDDGKFYSYEDCVRYGWLKDRELADDGAIASNLFVDQGRQLLAYLWAGKSPLTDHVVSKFAVGTGTGSSHITDTALESEVHRNSINGVDFPAPFVARAEFTLGLNDANGYLITEFGLFSASNALYARWLEVGVNKTSQFAPTFQWRIRF